MTAAAVRVTADETRTTIDENWVIINENLPRATHPRMIGLVCVEAREER